jgi:hypothetical protein
MTHVASFLTDRDLLVDDASRLEHALSLTQSVLPDSVSGQTIIGISRLVDRCDPKEAVQGITAAVDCLSSWTTALELYQCEENMSYFGDELKKPMAKDDAAPRKPLLARPNKKNPFTLLLK